MKGLESMPAKMAITVLLLFIIVGISMWQLDVFLSFKADKDFKEAAASLHQSIRTTQSMGDYGTFTTFFLTVPAERRIDVDMLNNRILAVLGNETLEINSTADFTKFCPCDAAACDNTTIVKGATVRMPGGKYDLRLYYGTLTDSQVKRCTLVFE